MNQPQDKNILQNKDGSEVEILKNRFDCVFLVPLKHVDSDIPLEQVIIQEHDLGDKNITEDEIKTILDSRRALLIFDGYDEYKKGTNRAIDAAITGERIELFVLVTSRPDYIGHGQIQNNGLSVHSIKKCTEQYLEDAEMADGFLKKAVSQNVSGLLRIPILLLMTCLLWIQNNTLPKNRGNIIRDIIDMHVLRAKKRYKDLKDTDQMLLHLGKLSYEASQRDTHKLHIKKVSGTLIHIYNSCTDIIGRLRFQH